MGASACSILFVAHLTVSVFYSLFRDLGEARAVS